MKKLLLIFVTAVLVSCTASYIQTEVDCSKPERIWNVKGPIIEQFHLWQVEALCGKGSAACLLKVDDNWYQIVMLVGDEEAYMHETKHIFCGPNHKQKE